MASHKHWGVVIVFFVVLVLGFLLYSTTQGTVAGQAVFTKDVSSQRVDDLDFDRLPGNELVTIRPHGRYVEVFRSPSIQDSFGSSPAAQRQDFSQLIRNGGYIADYAGEGENARDKGVILSTNMNNWDQVLLAVPFFTNQEASHKFYMVTPGMDQVTINNPLFTVDLNEGRYQSGGPGVRAPSSYYYPFYLTGDLNGQPETDEIVFLEKATNYNEPSYVSGAILFQVFSFNGRNRYEPSTPLLNARANHALVGNFGRNSDELLFIERTGTFRIVLQSLDGSNLRQIPTDAGDARRFIYGDPNNENSRVADVIKTADVTGDGTDELLLLWKFGNRAVVRVLDTRWGSSPPTTQLGEDLVFNYDLASQNPGDIDLVLGDLTGNDRADIALGVQTRQDRVEWWVAANALYHNTFDSFHPWRKWSNDIGDGGDLWHIYDYDRDVDQFIPNHGEQCGNNGRMVWTHLSQDGPDFGQVPERAVCCPNDRVYCGLRNSCIPAGNVANERLLCLENSFLLGCDANSVGVSTKINGQIITCHLEKGKHKWLAAKPLLMQERDFSDVDFVEIGCRGINCIGGGFNPGGAQNPPEGEAIVPGPEGQACVSTEKLFGTFRAWRDEQVPAAKLFSVFKRWRDCPR